MTKNRLKHSFSVAKKMKEITERYPDIVDATPEEMFNLGLVHDFGYILTDDKSQHASVGGMFLKEEGFSFWKEVFHHGFVQREFTSNELFLLNFCDMTTSSNGENVSMDERIDDIEARYGKNSVQVEAALKMKNFLENNELLKKIKD